MYADLGLEFAEAKDVPADLRAVSMDLVAERLGVSRRSLERLIAAGRLRTIYVGARHLVPIAELERLIAHGTGAKAAASGTAA
jgi:excisionase family DNA binding protein